MGKLCKACGQKGHWSGDAVCKKKPHKLRPFVRRGSGGKGKGKKGKGVRFQKAAFLAAPMVTPGAPRTQPSAWIAVGEIDDEDGNECVDSEFSDVGFFAVEIDDEPADDEVSVLLPVAFVATVISVDDSDVELVSSDD